MANSTSKHALNIHGTNPQFLIEKIVRSRIYDSMYWKQHCFALTSVSLIDKSIQLNSIGGTFEAQKICPFLCLVCKLLQIQPEKEILLEYLKFEEFKYLRAVAAMYVRLTFKSIEVYEILEPMLNDYRKLRYRGNDGSYSLLPMDCYIDSLLTEDRVCDITLPRLTKREVLEETEGLEERISSLEEVLISEKRKIRSSSSSSIGSVSGSESDDSFVQEIKSKKRRNREIREKVIRDVEMMDADGDEKGKGEGMEGDEDELDGYSSQEHTDEEVEGEREPKERFVSRSPSRSGSEKSDGNQDEELDRNQRFISKSPSRSPSP